jgi:uncharacterized protein (DUF302 family)
MRIKRGEERSPPPCSLIATQQFRNKKRWGEKLPSKLIMAIITGNKEEEGKEEKKEEEGRKKKKEDKEKKGWGWQW